MTPAATTTTNNAASTFNEADFDWVQLKKDCHVEVESKKDKLIRKITENPLVPIGIHLIQFKRLFKSINLIVYFFRMCGNIRRLIIWFVQLSYGQQTNVSDDDACPYRCTRPHSGGTRNGRRNERCKTII